MNAPDRGFGALLRFELLRTVVPLGRALISPALLAIWGILDSGVTGGLVTTAFFAAQFLAAVTIAFQVGRDRNDGTLAYFASLPVRGEVLAAVRFTASAILTLVAGIVLGVVGYFFRPEYGFPAIVIVGLSTMILNLMVGWIGIALLARFDWTKIVVRTMIGLMLARGGLALSGLLEPFGRLVEQLTIVHGTEGILALLGWGVWACLIFMSLFSFRFAARALQPNGGFPTPEALALIRSVQERASRAVPVGR